jgi:hypothetical protein
MRRRLVFTLRLFAATAFVLFWPAVALADNCGSLHDCWSTAGAAGSAAAGAGGIAGGLGGWGGDDEDDSGDDSSAPPGTEGEDDQGEDQHDPCAD